MREQRLADGMNLPQNVHIRFGGQLEFVSCQSPNALTLQHGPLGPGLGDRGPPLSLWICAWPPGLVGDLCRCPEGRVFPKNDRPLEPALQLPPIVGKSESKECPGLQQPTPGPRQLCCPLAPPLDPHCGETPLSSATVSPAICSGKQAEGLPGAASAPASCCHLGMRRG